MKTILILLALATGCTQPNYDVSVRINYVQSGIPADLDDFAQHGAMGWEDIGIGYAKFDPNDQDTYGNSANECSVTWYEDIQQKFPCIVTIHLTLVYQSELGGAIGVTYPHTRETRIAQNIDKFEFMETVTHEIGHSVFNASDHIPPDEMGIMHASYQGFETITEADKAYVARHTNGWYQE